MQLCRKLEARVWRQIMHPRGMVEAITSSFNPRTNLHATACSQWGRRSRDRAGCTFRIFLFLKETGCWRSPSLIWRRYATISETTKSRSCRVRWVHLHLQAVPWSRAVLWLRTRPFKRKSWRRVSTSWDPKEAGIPIRRYKALYKPNSQARLNQRASPTASCLPATLLSRVPLSKDSQISNLIPWKLPLSQAPYLMLSSPNLATKTSACKCSTVTSQVPVPALCPCRSRRRESELEWSRRP